MSEPIDIAVDLGATPPPLPEILDIDDLWEREAEPPPLIVDGILYQGDKMILGGTSKSNKSWSLLDLAISVASGQTWWGRKCTRMPVLYINFELQGWAIRDRFRSLIAARPECQGLSGYLKIWNLRGRSADLSLLRPQLEAMIAKYQFGLIILDPAYKLLGDRDENANGEIASLMNELEALARFSGAAIVVAHHFAKGDSTTKNAIDRMSGAGVWARDPDSILILTPHEEPDCYTVTSILRNLPQLPEFVVAWDFPLMRVAKELNPESLRRPQGKNKVCSDKEFIETVLTHEPQGTSAISAKAEKFGFSRRTTERYLQRLKEAGVIASEYGTYWRKNGQQN